MQRPALMVLGDDKRVIWSTVLGICSRLAGLLWFAFVQMPQYYMLSP